MELTFRGRPFGKSRHGSPPVTPSWALECWLWEDDSNTSEAVDSLLEGYRKNDIPVRTVLLDSPWSLRYNDFSFDSARYPNPGVWLTGLQDSGYRVVLWMTSMVNSQSDDTRIRESAEWQKSATDSGYLAGNGRQINWWKGRGGFIDYSDPAAMKWWQGMQKKVLDLGIDGWKLDGTATLFHSGPGPLPLPVMSTNAGLMTTRRYMDLYYRTEYVNGLKYNPSFVTLARSVDRAYHPEGFAPLDAAPVTWVGDQTHSWNRKGKGKDDNRKNASDGIELAMRNIMKAAKLGYSITGSDIAGFSGKTIQPELYIRWAEFSAFCGLFLNGGHGERALWKRSTGELEIIRKFSWLHTELIPYIYSYVVSAHDGGKPLQRPLKGKYHYMFGDWLLVAPVYEDDTESTVCLPEGKWRYLFSDRDLITGPTEFKKDFPLDEYPVYVREGAIIPMNICRSYSGFGDVSSEGYITILIYPSGKSEFRLSHPDNSGTTLISSEVAGRQLRIGIDGVHKAHILKIALGSAPDSIFLDGRRLSMNNECSYAKQEGRLIIRTKNYKDGRYQIFTGKDLVP